MRVTLQRVVSAHAAAVAGYSQAWVNAKSCKQQAGGWFMHRLPRPGPAQAQR